MAGLLQAPHNSISKAAIWFAKMATIVIGTASALFVSARLLVPYCRSILSESSTLWGVWIAAQIIVVIVWKLSDNNPDDEDRPTTGEKPTQPPPTVVKESGLETSPASPVDPKPSPDVRYPLEYVSTASVTAPFSGEFPPEQSPHESYLSTDSNEKKTSMVPPSQLEIERDTKLPSMEKDDDSMNETWRAIVEGGATPVRRPYLRKSDTWEGSPQVESLARSPAMATRPEMRKSATFREAATPAGPDDGWRRREALVVGRDELFGRVEAFIKMHHDNLRLQRMESEQRRFLEVVNHAY